MELLYVTFEESLRAYLCTFYRVKNTARFFGQQTDVDTNAEIQISTKSKILRMLISGFRPPACKFVAGVQTKNTQILRKLSRSQKPE